VLTTERDYADEIEALLGSHLGDKVFIAAFFLAVPKV
jgi:hypothetical protein